MSQSFFRGLRVIALVGLCAWSALAHAAVEPSFADFDRRARAGEPLSVVFFGASLTWGANATDPLLTSYRAVFADRLREAYPLARFRFWDAAIGGTGSQLGVFRLDRDVLSRRPDLVLLDFSANDNISTDDRETLSSYEALVRRIVLEAHAPVVQVIFPFRWDVESGTLEKMKRRTAHRAISESYQTALGDAIQLARERVAAGATTLNELWPDDGVHPGNTGYVLFADAAWSAFQAAIEAKRVCRAPEKMLYDETYLTSTRTRLSSLQPLPVGWQVGRPHLVSAYFDMLMSRWLDDEVVAGGQPAAGSDGKPATAVEPGRLSTNFRGSMVMLFGESTVKSGKYRVWLDGKVVEHRENGERSPLVPLFDAGNLGRRSGGNTHHVQVIATGLDPHVTHRIEIEPVFDAPDQELRLESICVAGALPADGAGK
ncbi:MAG TPA: SGNH/GDSL hydrolase family protein [Pirellulales bacterium]|jgi:lysophospholipase L1-like esterase|nr:SGNH/GDSL hydrolase family protein [Pirellulales bacterium]